jgi:hypothetical protein
MIYDQQVKGVISSMFNPFVTDYRTITVIKHGWIEQKGRFFQPWS